MIEDNWSSYTRIEKSGIIVARICQFEALFLIISSIFSLDIDIRILLEPCKSIEVANITQPTNSTVEAYTMMHRSIRKILSLKFKFI